MKTTLLLGLCLLPMSVVAQEMTDPLIIPYMYTWKISPNGQWFAGGSREQCDVYNMEEREMISYPGANYNTITNDGVLAIGGGKPTLLINGESVVPESLKGARSGSVQLISSSGNKLCGNINYPDAGINGFYACDIDENGVVGAPKPIPRPNVDFFGCRPQFVNMIDISSDGSTITGFVQDWRGYYCYPIIYRENEEGEWTYSYPAEVLFNPDDYPIPENPWLEEPKFPNFTDFMTPVAKTAYEDAIANYYMGLTFDIPDAKDYMTDEQWEAYYEASVNYNEWYYSHEEQIKNYDKNYNKILNSSVIFGLNEISISPDGNTLACTFLEYPDGYERYGIIKINIEEQEFKKYESPISDIFPTQVLSDETILISKPIIYSPDTYIILPDEDEMMNIREYFEMTHPDYLAWMVKYLANSGAIYTNDDKTLFVGSILAVDCESTFELTGGYNSFTYVFSPDIATVESIESAPDNHYRVFSIQGYKVLDTENPEDLKKLPTGIYVINGKTVQIK